MHSSSKSKRKPWKQRSLRAFQGCILVRGKNKWLFIKGQWNKIGMQKSWRTLQHCNLSFSFFTQFPSCTPRLIFSQCNLFFYSTIFCFLLFLIFLINIYILFQKMHRRQFLFLKTLSPTLNIYFFHNYVLHSMIFNVRVSVYNKKIRVNPKLKFFLSTTKALIGIIRQLLSIFDWFTHTFCGSKGFTNAHTLTRYIEALFGLVVTLIIEIIPWSSLSFHNIQQK